jgi:hypothetical protein
VAFVTHCPPRHQFVAVFQEQKAILELVEIPVKVYRKRFSKLLDAGHPGSVANMDPEQSPRITNEFAVETTPATVDAVLTTLQTGFAEKEAT